MRASVAICTHNRGSDTMQAIESLLKGDTDAHPMKFWSLITVPRIIPKYYLSLWISLHMYVMYTSLDWDYPSQGIGQLKKQKGKLSCFWMMMPWLQRHGLEKS